MCFLSRSSWANSAGLCDNYVSKTSRIISCKGVTDDPAWETYWKATNGIRLSGTPSFKTKLADTRLWQVSQLLAHANQIPESVKRALVPDSSTPASTSSQPAKR